MDDHFDQTSLEEDHFPFSWPPPSTRLHSSSPDFDDHYGPPCLLPLETDTSSSATFQVSSFPSWSVAIPEPAGDRAASVSKSHSEAEKRRRDRINAQLGALRKLIPKADKMDKAALLATVIDRVKDLKRSASQACKSVTVPTDVDEVTVDCDFPDSSSMEAGGIPLIRATISCADRPELFPEIIKMLKGLHLRIVAADIASVGGRIKSILVLCNNEEDKEHVVPLSSVKQSLNVVLSRIAASSMPSNYRARSKRQRFFLPSYQSR